MEFKFKSKVTIALILLLALLSVELYILFKPSKNSSAPSSVSEPTGSLSTEPVTDSGIVEPSISDPLVDDPLIDPQPEPKKNEIPNQDPAPPGPTPSPPSPAPVPTPTASKTTFVLKSKGPILFRTSGLNIENTHRSFSFLFKGLSNLNYVPRELKLNMAVILTTAEIESNTEILRDLIHTYNATPILELDADQKTEAINSEMMDFFVYYLNYSGIDRKFEYMIFPDFENVTPQILIRRMYDGHDYNVKLVQPSSKIDNNQSSGVLMGAVVVDLSQNPESVIQTLESHPQKDNRSSFLTIVNSGNMLYNTNGGNNNIIGQFQTDLEAFVRVEDYSNFSIDRENILEDSIAKLPSNSRDLMKTSLRFYFIGEDGIDAGGLTRDWYNSIAAELFKPERKLFIASDVDPTVFHPNYKLKVTQAHLRLYEFAGKFFAKALVDKIAFGLHFSDAFYKHILGLEPEFKDLEKLNKGVYDALSTLSKESVDKAGFRFTNFEIDVEDHETVELKDGGSDLEVTEENKAEFIALTADYMLTTGIEEQTKAFLRGFYSHLTFNLFAPLSVSDLDQLIAGAQNIDVEDWRLNTSYRNVFGGEYTANSQQVIWFWDALRSFTQEERRKVLQFVTGLSSVPIGGFANLRNRGSPQPFKIHKGPAIYDNGRLPALPLAHTCFYTIDLPLYRNYDELRERLLKAAEVGAGFGFG